MNSELEEKENVFYVPMSRKEHKGVERHERHHGKHHDKLQTGAGNGTGVITSTGKNKRGASGTPITPSLGQNVIRRKVDMPRRYLQFADEDIMRIEYESWLLSQRMARNDEVRKFYLMEQEAVEGRVSN